MVVKNIITIFAGIAVVAGVFAVIVLETTPDIDQVREATQPLQTVASAESGGYQNVDVDACVSGPDGAMGFHFVNFSLLDLELDPSEPEILVFIPDSEGDLRLGAVEYAVPIDMWDREKDEPPKVLGQSLHVNEELGLYVLHAWIFEENPAGVFADWNPEVSCLAVLPPKNQSRFAMDWRFGVF